MTGTLPWVAFGVGVALLLALDLFVINRGEKVLTVRQALQWSAFWIALAFLFAGFVWWWQGGVMAKEFVAAYLVEKSLSVDNIFVFLLVFTALGIGPGHQHKVLFLGIFGAIVLRLLFIIGGLTLLDHFSWTMYVFGALLILTAARMWRSQEATIDLQKNPVVRFTERRLAFDPTYKGHSFVTKVNGKLLFTPLVLALLAIESADIVFAVDSVPAVLAISRHPFIAFSSNVFAILGLRSLYFALAGCMNRFAYLHYGLAAILGVVGMKMIVAEWYHVPTAAALAFIAVALTVSIIVSVLKTRREECRVASVMEPHTPAVIPSGDTVKEPAT
ncbi:MAG: TerC family protein [Actinobacteria bacterium]|nr:TerC family protein [Actinomycetota bacterium]